VSGLGPAPVPEKGPEDGENAERTHRGRKTDGVKMEKRTVVTIYATNEDYNFGLYVKGIENGEKLKILGMVRLLEKELMKEIEFSVDEVDL